MRILGFIARGLPNKLIGQEVHLAEATVKWHVSALLLLYGSPNRTDLVREAISRGHISAETIPPSHADGG